MEERKFSEQELVRREKMQELIDKGIDPFGQRFDVTAYSKGIKEQYGEKTHEELEEMAVEVSVAGRIMTKRRKGKVCFMHIQDRDGQIQLYVRKDTIGEEAYEIVKKGDIGDIIGIKGTVFMTNTGECSIKVSEYTHLTKALRPLPEKFHGLSDIEERYRRRYVDLIMNEDAKKIAFTRPRIIRSIQHYLDSKNYVEVETPVLNPILGIPFVITPLINIVLGYILTIIGFCPVACLTVPWTTPPIIFGFLATGASIFGAITQAILIVVSIVIYTPFLISYEKYQNKQAANI